MDYSSGNDIEKSELSSLRSVEKVRQRLSMQQILGDDYKAKVKVRISHAVPHMWNAIQTVAESFSKRKELDIEIILSPQSPEDSLKLEQQMKEDHYRYRYSSDYDIGLDKPDIVVFYIAHTNVVFMEWGGCEKIRENAKYVAVIPYDNSVKFESKDSMNIYYNSINNLNADFFTVAKPVYDVIKDKYAKAVSMSNPKFDIIYRKMNYERCIPEAWKKLDEKKVILWTTIHGHDEWNANNFFIGLTFDVYIKDVISYFKSHKDMGLIFRPHPAYIQELVYMHKIWTEEDLQYIKDYFAHSENMVWDDSVDYGNAFARSDALITDDGTGITLSYLPTRKPICILRRNSIEIYSGTAAITQNYYKAHCAAELYNYFNMIEQGDDPLYEKRMSTVEEYIPVFDGKNGIRIVEKIMSDFMDKVYRT